MKSLLHHPQKYLVSFNFFPLNYSFEPNYKALVHPEKDPGSGLMLRQEIKRPPGVGGAQSE